LIGTTPQKEMLKYKKVDKMKKQYEKYKAWRLKKIHKWAQWYANFIIDRLTEAKSEWEFGFWITKGYMHDGYMIEKYEIYLD
jgi:hypothetical protein